ncbi:MAG: hypothetical protein AAF587_05095 [Bacteroidota bacterium]
MPHILAIFFITSSAILHDLRGQDHEQMIAMINRELSTIDAGIEQGNYQSKKLVFSCEGDPFDGSVIFYHDSSRIDKIIIDYYYEAFSTTIQFYLEAGQPVYQEVVEKMDIGYDVTTGESQGVDESSVRIYIRPLAAGKKRCVGMQIVNGREEIVIEQEACDNFQEAYFHQVIESFQLDKQSRVCLIYD